VSRYNPDAVDAAIAASRQPISKREAKAIHGLLGGWRVSKPLPPCKSCGAPTANFASLTCQPCKQKEA